jgi:hypothetical protein
MSSKFNLHEKEHATSDLHVYFRRHDRADFSNEPRSSSMINHYRLESDEDTLDAKSLPPSEKTLPFRDEDDTLRYPQLDLDPFRLQEMRRDEMAMNRYCE